MTEAWGRGRLSRAFGFGFGLLLGLGSSGCRQMHERHVFYPNGDGRRLVDVRKGLGLRGRATPADSPVNDRGKELPPMLFGR